MQTTPFNIETDLAPIPFERRHCQMAARLKEAGLPWKPHVGCFVWDRDEQIKVPSPFPERIYFILNLVRFLEIFDTVENITEKLIWVPTWHQARQLCDKMGVKKRDIIDILCNENHVSADHDVLLLYRILLNNLKKY